MLDAEMRMKLLISDRPWEHEPDREEWVHDLTRYNCTVWRHPTYGSLNGYVAMPKGHKMWGQPYNSDLLYDIEVHGGLTYAEEDKVTGEWVLGFDCNHATDFAPKLALTLMKYTGTTTEDLEFRMKVTKYRDWAYVKNEVCNLARQLKLINMNFEGEVK